MSTITPTSSSSSPRKLKILMLHGYTQSGPLFHAKTRALEKVLTKAFPPYPTTKPAPPNSLPYPGGIQLFYPTGPLPLRPEHIPGFVASDPDTVSSEDEIFSFGWWRDPGSGIYASMDAGLQIMADTIREAGGVDGVIGFSQGAAAAAMVASLLEPGRIAAFAEAQKLKDGMPYPSSFLTSPSSSEMINPPLKFAVSYAGFFAPHQLYQAFYEPKISTPTLHVIGSLDSVVEEFRSTALVRSCEKKTVVYHPGGHFVPIGKDMAGALVAFIRETCGEAPNAKEKSTEDMDVPF